MTSAGEAAAGIVAAVILAPVVVVVHLFGHRRTATVTMNPPTVVGGAHRALTAVLFVTSLALEAPATMTAASL